MEQTKIIANVKEYKEYLNDIISFYKLQIKRNEAIISLLNEIDQKQIDNLIRLIRLSIPNEDIKIECQNLQQNL